MNLDDEEEKEEFTGKLCQLIDSCKSQILKDQANKPANNGNKKQLKNTLRKLVDLYLYQSQYNVTQNLAKIQQICDLSQVQPKQNFGRNIQVQQGGAATQRPNPDANRQFLTPDTKRKMLGTHSSAIYIYIYPSAQRQFFHPERSLSIASFLIIEERMHAHRVQ